LAVGHVISNNGNYTIIIIIIIIINNTPTRGVVERVRDLQQ